MEGYDLSPSFNISAHGTNGSIKLQHEFKVDD